MTIARWLRRFNWAQVFIDCFLGVAALFALWAFVSLWFLF